MPVKLKDQIHMVPVMSTVEPPTMECQACGAPTLVMLDLDGPDFRTRLCIQCLSRGIDIIIDARAEYDALRKP